MGGAEGVVSCTVGVVPCVVVPCVVCGVSCVV